MTLAVFYVIAAATLTAAAGVVTSRNVLHAALLLLVTLAGVAGLFVLLLAEFLALVQVLIYGGAIVMVILFAIMLTRQHEMRAATEHRRWPVAAAVSIALFAVMVVAFTADSARYNVRLAVSISTEELGEVLFERWAIPFEIASIVLLVALVGAIVIARPVSSRRPGESGKDEA